MTLKEQYQFKINLMKKNIKIFFLFHMKENIILTIASCIEMREEQMLIPPAPH